MCVCETERESDASGTKSSHCSRAVYHLHLSISSSSSLTSLSPSSLHPLLSSRLFFSASPLPYPQTISLSFCVHSVSLSLSSLLFFFLTRSLGPMSVHFVPPPVPAGLYRAARCTFQKNATRSHSLGKLVNLSFASSFARSEQSHLCPLSVPFEARVRACLHGFTLLHPL